jgi:hypothetical protein
MVGGYAAFLQMTFILNKKVTKKSPRIRGQLVLTNGVKSLDQFINARERFVPVVFSQQGKFVVVFSVCLGIVDRMPPSI